MALALKEGVPGAVLGPTVGEAGPLGTHPPFS